MTISLAMNESRFGASPLALAAAAEAARDAHLYPDPRYVVIREALASHYRIPVAGIVVGNGAEELIELLVRAFAPAGSNIVFPRFSYILFGQVAARAGVHAVVAPDRAFGADVDAIIESVSARTSLVLLAQPNNPTGVLLPPDELVRLARDLPARVWLAIDAAYGEYLDPEHVAAISAAVAARERAMVLRTFSKAYGLAGLRIGWFTGPPDAAARLEQTRNLTHVNRIAVAAAVAALDGRAFVARVRERNAQNRFRLVAGLAERGIDVIPSAGNFVAAHFGSPAGAQAAYRMLLDHGYRVRPLDDYRLPADLRITVGTESDVAAVLQILPVAIGNRIGSAHGESGALRMSAAGS